MFEGEKHDGVSSINFAIEKGTAKIMEQFWQLWDYLVPESGRAQTAQGEMIRIAGRVWREFMVNGGANYDKDFEKMLKTFVKYAQYGNPTPNNGKAAKRITDILRQCGKNGYCNTFMCDGLCCCAVRWVSLNPDILPPLEADYTR